MEMAQMIVNTCTLIENNGSVVVEEVGPDGKSKGPKLSIQTTYLVVGDTPKGYESGGAIDPRLESIGKAYRIWSDGLTNLELPRCHSRS